LIFVLFVATYLSTIETYMYTQNANCLNNTNYEDKTGFSKVIYSVI